MSVDDILRNLPILVILTVSHFGGVLSEYCGTTQCYYPEKCCSNGMTCCYDSDASDHYITYKLHVWNMWYFWFIIIFIMMSCFGGCGYYRRKRMAAMSRLQQRQRQGALQTSIDLMSNRTRYPGQHQSYLAYTGPGVESDMSYLPPPYSEVVSQPDMYPPNKSELPPYPGAPVISADSQGGNTSLPLNPHHLNSQIPQPPPYSDVITGNTSENTTNNSPAANAPQSAEATNQTSASSNSTNQRPASTTDATPVVIDETNRLPPV
ncbi:hypothetical protein SNE40_023404 [Patella caerulea]|uniref:WW domain binding protein VOPP1 n=1 Tax=Patella caerulea TaxID=87958 RepID=A0AAN8FYE7_PATCE